MPGSPDARERERIEAVYAEYARTGNRRWSGENPANGLIEREQLGAVERGLGRAGSWPIQGLDVLDIGCGSGATLEYLRNQGGATGRLIGLDIRASRLQESLKNHPEIAMMACSGESIALPDNSIDIAVAFLVFSSIIDIGMRRRVASEISRVLRPGGILVWYDLRIPNPGNRHVRPISRSGIQHLFPGFALDLRSATVLPPVARRLGARADAWYPILGRSNLLHSHLVGLLHAPGSPDMVPSGEVNHSISSPRGRTTDAPESSKSGEPEHDRESPRLLFAGFHTFPGANRSQQAEPLPDLLGKAGYVVRWAQDDQCDRFLVSKRVLRRLQGAAWADAVVVNCRSGAEGASDLLLIRMARIRSRPAIVVVSDDSGLPIASGDPVWVRSAIRLATRVVATSPILSPQDQKDGLGARSPTFEEQLLLWEGELSACGLPMPSDGTDCRPLGLRDIDAVVEIHRQAFPDSVITKFGAGVTSRYYRWQFIGPHPAPFALGLWQEGTLVAYLIGGLRSGALAGFVRRYAVTNLLSALCRPRVIYRIASSKLLFVARILFGGAGSSPSAPAAPQDQVAQCVDQPGASFGVLSIAVRPSVLGTGAAVRLMQETEQIAISHGFVAMHLTVQPENARAIAFYEKLGWSRRPGPGGWSGAMAKPIGSGPHTD